MIVGITGTHRGTTAAQHLSLVEELRVLRKNHDFLWQGCCRGVDRAAAQIWWDLGGIVHHLPGDQEQRHWAVENRRDGDIVDDVQPYMVRNERIARARWLVAVPREDKEIIRSGTWATVRRARKARTPILLVLPSGEVCRDTGPAQVFFAF